MNNIILRTIDILGTVATDLDSKLGSYRIHKGER